MATTTLDPVEARTGLPELKSGSAFAELPRVGIQKKPKLTLAQRFQADPIGWGGAWSPFETELKNNLDKPSDEPEAKDYADFKATDVIKETAVSTSDELKEKSLELGSALMKTIVSKGKEGFTIFGGISAVVAKEIGEQIAGPKAEQPHDENAPSEAQLKEQADMKKIAEVEAKLKQLEAEANNHLGRLQEETGMSETDIKDVLHVSQDLKMSKLNTVGDYNEATRLFIGRQQKLSIGGEEIMVSGGGSQRDKNMQAGLNAKHELNTIDTHGAMHASG